MVEHPTPGSADPPGGDDEQDAAVEHVQALLRQMRQRRESDPDRDDQWDRFLRANARLFLKLVRERGWSEADRDDGIQELWLTLLSRLPDLRFDGRRGHLGDWVSAVARHRLADEEEHRRAHSMEPLGPNAGARLPGHEPDPAVAFERECVRELVRDALAELRTLISPRDFEAFLLRWFEGLSVCEISRRLGMTEGQLWTCHHRAIRKLRPLLERRLDGGRSIRPRGGEDHEHDL